MNSTSLMASDGADLDSIILNRLKVSGMPLQNKSGTTEPKIQMKRIWKPIKKGDIDGRIIIEKEDPSKISGKIVIEPEKSDTGEETLCMCLCGVAVTDADIIEALDVETDLANPDTNPFLKVVNSGIS